MEGNEKLAPGEGSSLSEKVLEHGPQPLDALMNEANVSNTEVVQALPELHLTHKMIGKGRRGRRISRKVQGKIVKAVNAVLMTRRKGEEELFRPYAVEDLFTYDGR